MARREKKRLQDRVTSPPKTRPLRLQPLYAVCASARSAPPRQPWRTSGRAYRAPSSSFAASSSSSHRLSPCFITLRRPLRQRPGRGAARPLANEASAARSGTMVRNPDWAAGYNVIAILLAARVLARRGADAARRRHGAHVRQHRHRRAERSATSARACDLSGVQHGRPPATPTCVRSRRGIAD